MKIIIALACLALASCSFTQSPDGAKTFNLDGAQLYNVAKVLSEK